jgi:hypothetical protein
MSGKKVQFFKFRNSPSLRANIRTSEVSEAEPTDPNSRRTQPPFLATVAIPGQVSRTLPSPVKVLC